MAGNRLIKFGTVFTRVRDLMHSGIIRQSEKPIWYDVYAAFPPKREPLDVKSTAFVKTVTSVPEIFYPEDTIRAKFFERYGTGPRPLDLSKPNFVSTCQKFVEKFTELQGSEERPDVTFEASARALLADGIVLRLRAAAPAPAGSRDVVLDLKLTDMMAEHQHPPADSEGTSK